LPPHRPQLLELRRSVAVFAALALVCLATNPASALPSATLTLRGTLVMVHEGPTMHYFLDVGGRLSRELIFSGVTNLRPGAPLEVHGAGREGAVVVSGVSRLAARAAPAPSTVGTRKLLVILVAWPGHTVSTDPATANDFVFGTGDLQRRSVKQWYEDVSYGQLEWTGDVTPILNIVAPTGGCNLSTIANRSDTAAAAAGYTLGNYDNRMYDFPDGYCNGAFGEVAGARTWISDGLFDIDDGYQRMVPDHELGHNLGEWHGHGLDCGANTLTSACITGAGGGAPECDSSFPPLPPVSPPCVSEYGHAYDVMGNNWTSDGVDAVNWFGIWHEMQLGWVSGRTITDNQPATTQDHPFTIGPIERNSGDVGLTLNTTAGRTYVIEYRQPLGQDAFLSGYPDATDGVLISMANPVSGFGSDTGPVNLDTAPGSDASNTYSDWFDAAMGVGETFTDVDGGFSLTVDAVSPTGASVTVHWIGAPSTTTLDQMDASVSYNGWSGAVDAAANGGAYRVSHTKDDTSTWKSPVATSLSWIARIGPNRGRANVTIDGVNKGNVDLYSAAPASLTKTYAGLARTAHTIVIKVLGTKNASSSGTDVALDAFVVGSTATQESAPAILYDTWKNTNSVNAEGGNYRLGSLATARASVRFTGTAIDWITAKGKTSGKASVSIDGVSKGTVDLYAPVQTWRSAISYAGLAPGAHTIVIQVLGQKRAAATGTRVVIDGFVVHA
jgi:hypothetical protein